MSLPVLIVDLDEPNFGELLEIQIDEVGNVEVPAFGQTHAFEIHMGDPILQFKFTVACESVIDRDPAVGVFFRRAGTFEVFIQNRANDIIGTRPADSGRFKWR